MSLAQLIDDQACSIDQISRYLDGLSHDERMNEMRGMKNRHVKELFARAASAEEIGLDYFVPENVPPLKEVIHYGRNSLPAFNFFQKRFARPEGGGDRLIGYNEQSMRWITGPGYFVATPTDYRSEWKGRGGSVVDYFQVPDDGEKVVEGWPVVKSNSSGLQFFIYHKTRDFMRRVSAHMSVGAAFRNESDKEMGAYFVLCREDQ